MRRRNLIQIQKRKRYKKEKRMSRLLTRHKLTMRKQVKMYRLKTA